MASNPFAGRPALPLSIQTGPTTASLRGSPSRPSPLAPTTLASHAASPPPSAPSTPGTSAEFARNVQNLRSFSQNPRWRRHSFDGGRSRVGSIVAYGETSGHDQLDSPVTPSYYGDYRDEKGRLLSSVAFPQSPLYSPFFFPPRRKWYKDRRTVALATAAAFALFVFGGMVGFSLLSRPGATDWWGFKSALEEYGVASFKPAKCENPYAEFGRVHVDLRKPENNRWLPYDPTCEPPALMADLRRAIHVNQSSTREVPLSLPLPRQRPAPNPSLPLPWLHGKTVLLFGDHVERNHNKDFCRFAGGKFASIGRDHPLSPPRFVNGIDEKLGSGNQENFDGTRPAVCYVEEYDFMIVSVFHFGLANRVEFEQESLLYDPHFYPPVAVDDRLTHIVLPLLDSLNRPHPDLIEFSSGFWDLRHFAALDELAGQDPYYELSNERLAWYTGRLTHALADVGAVFPRTPILWRTLHHTPKFNQTSPARVAALDQLSRKVVSALNEARNRAEARRRLDQIVHLQRGAAQDRFLVEREQADSVRLAALGRRGKTKGKAMPDRQSSKAPFLNRVKQRIGSSERVKEVELGNDETSLRGLLRVDEWGSLMRGQEATMENIHTPPLPGGYLWGDMMLFELRRLVFNSHHRQ